MPNRNEKFDALVEQAKAQISADALRRIDALARLVDQHTDSPIEAQFALAMIASEAPIFFDYSLTWSVLEYYVSFHPELHHEKYAAMAGAEFLKDSPFVALFPQQEIGRYRVDFVVLARVKADCSLTKMVIECDGHDFHERTKEQAARDKSRDRFLTSLGYSVYRFTGSEIHKDPFDCAAEILNVLETIAHEGSE